jgi:predicted DNA-binding protein YlxM (UPF0122 family)
MGARAVTLIDKWRGFLAISDASPKQQNELRRMHDTGDYSINDLAEVFSISRPTVYRTLNRHCAT